MRASEHGDTPTLDQESALRLSQGLQPLRGAVLLLGTDGRVLWLSESLLRMGATREDEGRPWTQLLTDSGHGEVLAERLRASGSLSDEPVELRSTKGSPLPVSLSAASLGPRLGGSPAVAILRPRDAETARQHPGIPAPSVLDALPDAVAVLDAGGCVSYANAALVSLTGYRREEIQDLPFRQLLAEPSDAGELALGSGLLRDHDLELRGRDGRTLSASLSTNVIHGPSGEVIATLACLRDVSQRRSAEDSLSQKNTELEQSVHTVSHDLRSPVVSLLGFTRLLRDDYGTRLDGTGLQFLRRIEEAGRTMEQLIRDLQELSHLGRPAEVTSADPKTVLLQVAAELKPRLDEGQVHLDLPVAPPLLQCDRTRLYQLFSNLLNNALDYMGEVAQPRIEVRIESLPGAHEICVRDNGRGIEAQHHEAIFEIFKSVGSSSNGRRGTGIGLAIVKKVAEAQGGSVRVLSRPGEGAAFFVTLPHGAD